MREVLKMFFFMSVVLFSFCYGLSSFALSIPNPTLDLFFKRLSQKLAQQRLDKTKGEETQKNLVEARPHQPPVAQITIQSSCNSKAGLDISDLKNPSAPTSCQTHLIKHVKPKAQSSISGL